MFKKQFKLERELKRVQKKGIYNPKIRVYVLVGTLMLTILISSTYAFFYYNSDKYQAYNSKINKNLKINVSTDSGIIYKSTGYIKDGTLSDKILKDNTIKTNANLSVSHTDNGLFVQRSDNTKSIDALPTYFFRGTVDNNYVDFAGKTWRIVRINEDGTIRLVSTESAVSGIYGSTSKYEGSNAEKVLEQWYKENLSTYDRFIATTTYCNDTSGNAYDRVRSTSGEQTFTCSNVNDYIQAKIGLITADELVYSGFFRDATENTNTFLEYIAKSNPYSWTMTAHDSSNGMILASLGWQYSNENSNYYLYPVINLKAETRWISGDGTLDNKYTFDIPQGNDSIIGTALYQEETTFFIRPYDGYMLDQEKTKESCDSEFNYDESTNSFSFIPVDDITCNIVFKNTTLSSYLTTEIFFFGAVPDFIMGEPSANGTNSGSGLYKLSDAYGASVYYRGNVTNNYVSFANKLWRIVRINGDGSTRLILDDKIGEDYYNTNITGHYSVGYIFKDSSGNWSDSTVKDILDGWYNSNLSNYSDKITENIFCNDTQVNIAGDNPRTYAAFTRITNGTPQLTCAVGSNSAYYGGALKLKVGLLSADEAMLAGISGEMNATTSDNYLIKDYGWWTMTPANSSSSAGSNVYAVYRDTRYLGEDLVDDTINAIRPVINLKSNVQFTSGDGTYNTPYVIE